MLAERQDHKLFEETIAEHELFSCAGDIAIVMQYVNVMNLVIYT